MSTIKRAENGQFVKGHCGGGRKAIPPDIKEAFNMLLPTAVLKLKSIVEESNDEKLVLEAAKTIFDRVLGKAPQSINLDANVNNSINIDMLKDLTLEELKKIANDTKSSD